VQRIARIGLVAVLFIFGIGAWWLLPTDASKPRAVSLAGIQDSVTIRWGTAGRAIIDAQSDIDALAALGYAHGRSRGWTVALWRQTALGRLSRWFGPGTLPLDQHARRLQLAHQAQVAYDRLPPTEQKRFDAYARGLNAALQSERVQAQDPFLLLGISPNRWEPWHTLAVERLLAWLATSPLDPEPETPASVEDFLSRDQQLRRWLHLHGWNRSVAWAARPSGQNRSSRPALFQRHVLGATAAPVLQEVVIDRAGTARLSGTTFPGVPLLPTGATNKNGWASLVQSKAQLRRIPFDSTRLAQRYERLTPTGGDEQLVRIRQIGRTVVLGRSSAQAPPADTVHQGNQIDGDSSYTEPQELAWVLRWSGFSTATDLPAWLARVGFSPPDDTTSFHLFAADGLRVSADGSWTVLGAPSVIERDSGQHIVVGNTPWARHQAQSLHTQYRTDASLNVEEWSASDSSMWAAGLLPQFDSAVDRLQTTHPDLQNIVTYLRNWDNRYGPSSIGATIFDRWVQAYRADLGHLPVPQDSAAYFSTYRQHQALLRALDSLRAQLGPDVRQWRWEQAVPDRRYFPVWSADSLLMDDLQEISATQYAPLARQGRGHPSTLSGGQSLVTPSSTAPSPTTWEGWMSPTDSSFMVRRYAYDPSATFARSRMESDPPSPVRLSPDSTSETTTLVPAGRNE